MFKKIPVRFYRMGIGCAEINKFRGSIISGRYGAEPSPHIIIFNFLTLTLIFMFLTLFFDFAPLHILYCAVKDKK